MRKRLCAINLQLCVVRAGPALGPGFQELCWATDLELNPRAKNPLKLVSSQAVDPVAKRTLRVAAAILGEWRELGPQFTRAPMPKSKPSGPDSSLDTWSVYLVRCADGALYTGIARDVARRLGEHQSDSGKGAKYLRGKGPLELAFECPVGERGLALRVERRIKRLTRERKLRLIDGEDSLEPILLAASHSLLE